MGAGAPPAFPLAAGRPTAFALRGILGVFWAAFVFVRPTNFGGWDEWLVVSLASDRIGDLPYENRPLSLVFNAVAPLQDQTIQARLSYSMYSAVRSATARPK